MRFVIHTNVREGGRYMACGHKLLDDYPIVVTVLNGRIEIEEVRSNCEVVDNYLTERELSKVYWILDAATIDFSREAAIYMAEITQRALPGSEIGRAHV